MVRQHTTTEGCKGKMVGKAFGGGVKRNYTHTGAHTHQADFLPVLLSRLHNLAKVRQSQDVVRCLDAAGTQARSGAMETCRSKGWVIHHSMHPTTGGVQGGGLDLPTAAPAAAQLPAPPSLLAQRPRPTSHTHPHTPTHPHTHTSRELTGCHTWASRTRETPGRTGAG